MISDLDFTSKFQEYPLKKVYSKYQHKYTEDTHKSPNYRYYNTIQFCVFESIKLKFGDYSFNFITIKNATYLYLNLSNKSIFIQVLECKDNKDIFSEKLKKQENGNIVILIKFNITDIIQSYWCVNSLICKLKQSKISVWKDILDELHSIIYYYISS